MAWLQNNSWIFVIIALVLLIVLVGISIYLIIKVKVITQNTVDSSLKMSATLMFESDYGAEFMDISIYNTNFRDVTVRDFGINYRNQHLNFVAEYVEAKQLVNLPVVPARSSISFRVDPQRVEKFILGHNYKSKKVSNVYNVVVDSIGNQFEIKNRGLSKILSTRQKDRVRQAKKILHEQKVADYRAAHDDRIPLSDYIWRLFHRYARNDSSIIRLADSLSENDAFSSRILPEPRAESEAEPLMNNTLKELVKDTGETVLPTSSGEIKVSFLEPEKKPRKRTTAKKPVAVAAETAAEIPVEDNTIETKE